MQTSARETYAMLGSEPIWQAASVCHEALSEIAAPHVVIGGVAVCLHGYRRNTVDIDLLVRRVDMRAIHKALTGAGFVWDELAGCAHTACSIAGMRSREHSSRENQRVSYLEKVSEDFFHGQVDREFRTPAGIPVQFVAAGDRAGKGSEVILPNPADDGVAVLIEGLPVLSLPALIESKLACGEGDGRRMHRDFADVVELIAIRGLDGTFARHLHKAVRATFRRLVRQVG
jgi:hypothetical protein